MLTDADMPPVESLTPDSDFRPFLSPGISEELQRLALRRLFQSPAFNELCPLEGEYFDAQGYKPLGKLITHEMRAQLKREAAKLKEKAHAALESTAVDGQVPSNKPPRAPGATAASPRDTQARAPRTDKLTRVSMRHPARARKS